MQGKSKFYFLALSVLPLMFIFRVPAVTQQTQMASQAIMRPLLDAGSHVSSHTNSFFNYFGIFWNTFRTQQHNQQRIDKLESQLTLLQETMKENQRLRMLLDFRENVPEKTIAARVIGWDLSLWQQRIILDKGSRDGLVKDMAVVTPKGLIGRVLETGPHTARVILLTDPASRISSWTADGRVHGVTSGDGSAELSVKYLDLESEIKVGEEVLSSGLTDQYPKGLRIGTVTSVMKDRNGLHWIAKVTPFATHLKLEEVLCIAYSPKN